MRGWGVCSRAVCRLGRVWSHFRSICSWVEAGGAVMMAIVNAIGNDDMACRGCANVINGVVSGNSGSGWLVATVLGVV
jgi:hypothetical protein